MANRVQFSKLSEGVQRWNAWRQQNPEADINLKGAVLRSIDLRNANLNDADLSGAKLTEAKLGNADLGGANLFDADLTQADMPNVNLAGALLGSARMWSVRLNGADLRFADLAHASLRWADLSGANLSEANLEYADLVDTTMVETNLLQAQLSYANLSGSTMTGVSMVEADLSGATLRGTKMCRAILSKADLSRADLYGADLTAAQLSEIDFRSATLQNTKLDGATANDVQLWETQRADWSIRGIVCEGAFWDEGGEKPTEYAVGEFERLHSDQSRIELFYKGGISTFEVNTLPALLHHLASLHRDTNIRLRSIEETGGGVRISINIGDAEFEAAEKIKADAMQIVQAQLALRDNEILRLQIQKEYLENFVSEKLVKAMLTAETTQRIVFKGPVYQPVLTAGDAEIHQTINDNSALLALLKNMMDHRADLELSLADSAELDSELHSATAELQKKIPDKTILSKSIGFIQKLATEAVTKAAGKFEDKIGSGDWQAWLHQLNQFIHHWK
jgi:uncharacterized protein YjbI with pentapeptide repeats